MQCLKCFLALDVQLLAQKFECIVYRFLQHCAYRKEVRLVVIDNAAVGRDVDLAVGKCVKCIYCFIR